MHSHKQLKITPKQYGAFLDLFIKKALSHKKYKQLVYFLYDYSDDIIGKRRLLHLINMPLERFPRIFNHIAANASLKDPASIFIRDSNNIITVSYTRRKLSDVVVQCSARGALEYSVLNDVYVSEEQTIRGAPYVYRQMAEEQELMNIDDQRHDLDLFFEQNTFALRCLLRLQERLASMPPAEAAKTTITRDELGGAVSVNAIVRAYGTRHACIIDRLQEAPSAALPIVINRLQLINQEYAEKRAKMNKAWRLSSEEMFENITRQKTIAACEELKKELNQSCTLGSTSFSFPFAGRADDWDACIADATELVLTATQGAQPLSEDVPSLAWNAYRFVRTSGIGVEFTNHPSAPDHIPLLPQCTTVSAGELRRKEPLLRAILREDWGGNALEQRTHRQTAHGLYHNYVAILSGLRVFGFDQTADDLQALLRSEIGHQRTIELSTAMIALDHAAFHILACADSRENICLLSLSKRFRCPTTAKVKPTTMIMTTRTMTTRTTTTTATTLSSKTLNAINKTTVSVNTPTKASDIASDSRTTPTTKTQNKQAPEQRTNTLVIRESILSQAALAELNGDIYEAKSAFISGALRVDFTLLHPSVKHLYQPKQTVSYHPPNREQNNNNNNERPKITMNTDRYNKEIAFIQSRHRKQVLSNILAPPSAQTVSKDVRPSREVQCSTQKHKAAVFARVADEKLTNQLTKKINVIVPNGKFTKHTSAKSTKAIETAIQSLSNMRK